MVLFRENPFIVALRECRCKSVIIDFETLGNAAKHPNTCIAQCGVLFFDPEKPTPFLQAIEQGLEWKINLHQQIAGGRHWDQDTVDFWAKQPYEAQQRVIVPREDDIPIKQFAKELEEAFNDVGYTPQDAYNGGRIWVRGTAFDINLLNNVIMTYLDDRDLYPFWAERDLRSFIDASMIAADPTKDLSEYRGYINIAPWGDYPDGLVKHSALHDCAYDLVNLQRAIALAQHITPFV